MENLNRTVSAHNSNYNHNNSLFLSRTNSLFPSRTNSLFPNSSKVTILRVPYKIRSEHSRSFSTKIDTDFQLNLLNNDNSLLVINNFLLKDNFLPNNSSSNQDSFKIQEVFKPISNC